MNTQTERNISVCICWRSRSIHKKSSILSSNDKPQRRWMRDERMNGKIPKVHMHRCTHTKSHYYYVFCLWLVFINNNNRKCIYWKIKQKTFNLVICLHFLLNLFDVALICFFLSKSKFYLFFFSLSLPHSKGTHFSW